MKGSIMMVACGGIGATPPVARGAHCAARRPAARLLVALLGAFAIGCAEAPGLLEEERLAATLEPSIPWPGRQEVVTVDATGAYPNNLSALAYEPARPGRPALLWAMMNGPTKLFRLLETGAAWRADAASGWARGKTLRYPTGSGTPDAEGLTTALSGEHGARFLYVASEHQNESFSSRPSILRFDVESDGATLTATHEWNLTSDLPPLGANTGIEGITFVPDGALAGMIDASTGVPYDPARYGDHAGGLFFVGVEQSGTVYVYALNHATSRAQRVTTLESGLAGVMALEYDDGSGYLWAWCDDTCGNRAALLRLDLSSAPGRFAVARVVQKPTGLPPGNHEGIALAPDSACVNGDKPFFWATDGAVEGHAIHRGSVACGRSF